MPQAKGAGNNGDSPPMHRGRGNPKGTGGSQKGQKKQKWDKDDMAVRKIISIVCCCFFSESMLIHSLHFINI